MVGFSVAGLLLLHCGATQTAAAQALSPSFTQPAAALRPFHEINADMRSALQHEVATKNATHWASTVVHLTEIYREIMLDRRLPTSETLMGYRVKLRSRLLGIQKELERNIKREKKNQTGNTSQGVVPVDPIEQHVSEQLAMILSLSSDSLGGPSTIYKYGGDILGARGGAARGDYGPALVELIRRTISPDSWDVNGGNGTIVYYRPWFALVVRARAEVHEQIGGLLGGGR